MEKEAKRRVTEAKGDPNNPEWVLSMTFLQFGKYRGKSFLWLLQNDVGWAVMVMADHQNIRETMNRQGDPQWDNKEALYRYIKE